MSRLKSVEFTELMSGFIHRTQLDMVVDKKAVYESAFRAAKGRGEIGRLLVSVSVFKDHELENESQPSVSEKLVASGILRLRPKDFVSEMDDALSFGQRCLEKSEKYDEILDLLRIQIRIASVDATCPP
ncbi:uncharacterized protein TrAFT101_000400 [Trichoderma asperellum]|uniref:uncharacterized protein n=1 Tax=Trichoderma asperellum TaxID=101201 RepID=UPI003321F53B|nr:hypothetical protein TrAFT101_000400 [Trichoderma asperellum]